MENQDRKRFIEKINVIRNVLIQEHENADFIAPSEKPYLEEVIDDLSLLHTKMAQSQ